MDAAYDSIEIGRILLGHKPIIREPPRSVDMKEALTVSEERRYVVRSGSERINEGWRRRPRRGYDKVLDLMFGMTVLTPHRSAVRRAALRTARWPEVGENTNRTGHPHIGHNA